MKRSKQVIGSAVTVTYLGTSYRVPAGLPIVSALEFAGVPIRHGSGCRQGFCGACALLYRLPGSSKMHGALACQTPVREGMDICGIPRPPHHRKDFDPSTARYAEDLTDLYPELDDCTTCGACTDICPIGIDVEGVVQSLRTIDLMKAADLASTCVSCGLCAVRCPVDISPFTIAIQAVRTIGYLNRSSAPAVQEKIQEIDSESDKKKFARLGGLKLKQIRTNSAELRSQVLRDLGYDVRAMPRKRMVPQKSKRALQNQNPE